ncbi:hypothetical protein [Eleftheria terrae]|uniref:hypothetical protein n=1 Tax=Eleftheria terrae TaxID=1597781 RepID=UPI00263BCC69|nr:hypothetical protein [Eleftheria terrae]WKB50518.1 hypothetical protein N7L95_00280 [Eleftheria terrae]
MNTPLTQVPMPGTEADGLDPEFVASLPLKALWLSWAAAAAVAAFFAAHGIVARGRPHAFAIAALILVFGAGLTVMVRLNRDVQRARQQMAGEAPAPLEARQQ